MTDRHAVATFFVIVCFVFALLLFMRGGSVVDCDHFRLHFLWLIKYLLYRLVL